MGKPAQNLIVFSALFSLLGACGSAPQMTVEEAKLIAQRRNTSPDFDPAPRSLDDLKEKLAEYTPLGANCEAIRAERSEAIERSISGLTRGNSRRRSFDAIVLTKEVAQQLAAGRYDTAATNLDRAIARLSGHEVRQGALYALATRVHAQSGNLWTARAHRSEVARIASRHDADTYTWEPQLLAADQAIALAEGDLVEAEDLLRRLARGQPDNSAFADSSYVRTTLASILTRQGRYAEALAELRPALRERFDLDPARSRAFQARAMAQLSETLFESGELDDAVWAIATALALFEAACVEPGSLELARARRIDIDIHAAQGDWQGVLERIELTRRELAHDPEQFDRLIGRSPSYALALIEDGQVEAGLSAATAATEDAADAYGPDSHEAAEAAAIRAIGLARSGRRAEAADTFAEHIPLIMSGRDELSATAGQLTRSARAERIIDAYAGLLEDAIGRGERVGRLEPVDALFSIASVGAGGQVQRALGAAIARASPDDPRLVELLRREQEVADQLNASQAALANVAFASTAEISTTRDLTERAAELRAAHRVLIDAIRRDYPRFLDFVLPRSVALEELRQALRADEALVLVRSFGTRTHVWSVTRDAAPAFVALDIGENDLAERVAALRRVLATFDPRADLTPAYELYETLLAPTRNSWGDARILMVVAGGALGTIPFSALLEAPPPERHDGALALDRFSWMRWLIEDRAIARLPAVANLVALRSTGAARLGERRFLGFGDPIFDPAEAGSPESEAHRTQLRPVPETRSLRSARLTDLAPLPDTGEEIKAVARVLGADQERDLWLQRRATEVNLRGLSDSGALADYRIVSFATHGLVPGDLDGLLQPALALSHPSFADGQGDGLLTMTEIVDLDLDAEWVVLSACNTATAGAAGAEAFSGLARAFFQAGARSLLVSHWPVVSAPTRDLMVAVFQHYRAGSNGRAEALRRGMLDLIQAGSSARSIDAMAYAHPMVWAPFELLGDPG